MGAIQGYRALRHFRKADSTEFEANVWVRLTTTDAGRFGLAIIERGAAAVPWPLFDASITIAGIVTDHDWTIELVSSDIERILGRSPEDFKGSSSWACFRPPTSGIFFRLSPELQPMKAKQRCGCTFVMAMPIGGIFVHGHGKCHTHPLVLVWLSPPCRSSALS